MKTKDKTMHILKKQNDLNLYKKIILVILLILIISRFYLYLYLYVTYLILNICILFYLANSIYNNAFVYI